MYMELGVPHHKPYFHAYYQGSAAVFSFDPVNLLEGDLPPKQRRLVEAWAEIHQLELMNAWDLLQKGRLPNPIEPLR